MRPTQQFPLPSNLKLKARELRQSATQAEKILWELFRNKQLNGHKFRRQHPIAENGQFILDFFCRKSMLGIELDGGYHETTTQRELDNARTNTLEELGITVIRFKNEEVLHAPGDVLEEILKAIESVPSP